MFSDAARTAEVGTRSRRESRHFGISAAYRRSLMARVLASADAAAALFVFALLAVLLVPSAFNAYLIVIETALTLAVFAAAGMYSPAVRLPCDRLRNRTFATAAVVLLDYGLHAAVDDASIAHVVLSAPLLVLATHYAEAIANVWLRRKQLLPARVLVLGSSEIAERTIAALRARSLFAMRPVAVWRPDATGTVAPHQPTAVAGLPVIYSIADAPEPLDLAVRVGGPALLAFERIQIPTTDRPPVVRLGSAVFGDAGSVAKPSARPSASLSRFAKRYSDIVIAALAAIPAGVVVGAAAVAVKLVDRGPAFYRQTRIGENGRPVQILKIRSMYCDADRRLAEHLESDPNARQEWERCFKLRQDPRILPGVGHLIRKTSIDELPQIWNVLKGEMSVVGPRPFPAYHLAKFDEEFRALRTTVPPGLTGLWQVSTRSEGDLAAQKADDLFYIRNRSFWMDFYILLQTVPAVVSGAGAR